MLEVFPGVVDEMPFCDKKTMICGLNVFHETQDCELSVMGLVASYNRTATKYWTATQVMEAG